jgi:hypothetical protein
LKSVSSKFQLTFATHGWLYSTKYGRVPQVD